MFWHYLITDILKEIEYLDTWVSVLTDVLPDYLIIFPFIKNDQYSWREISNRIARESWVGENSSTLFEVWGKGLQKSSLWATHADFLVDWALGVHGHT